MGPWGMGRYVNSVVLSRSRAADPRGPEPTCPLSCPVCLQSPAVVPTWRTTFLQVENGSLDSRKNQVDIPRPRTPISKNSNVHKGGEHSLGRALARRNTRPDTVTTIIRECHPHGCWKKKMRLNRPPRPRRATPRHAGAKLDQGFPPRPWVVGTQAKAGAELCLPVRG